MSSYDITYYRERLESERAMAASADDKIVTAVHEALARAYQARIDEAGTRLMLGIVSPG